MPVPEEYQKTFPNISALVNRMEAMGLKQYKDAWDTYELNDFFIKNTEDYTDIINAHDTNDIIIIWHWHLDEEPVKFMFKQLADPNITYSKFAARYNNFENERALRYLD